MIPQFPTFKHVEITDREAVEAHTQKYDPYSDFNFTSLWAWDTSGERMISELNGNLIVRFTDYSTNEPFLSFLGTNESEHTARTLIDYCRAEGLPTTLKLVPEISIKDIRRSVLNIEEDRDNFDYICSVPEHSSLRGSRYRAIRHRLMNFTRDNSDIRVEIIDLNKKNAQEQIDAVIHVWEINKIGKKKEYEIAHESTAIKRLFKTAKSHSLLVTGVFLGEMMIGFHIIEILPNENSISHFWKADTSHTGVYDFLIQECAKHLETLSVARNNWEQDLGIPGLRTSKMTLRPIYFLKKFTVSSANL